jgi:hypothetical protein
MGRWFGFLFLLDEGIVRKNPKLLLAETVTLLAPGAVAEVEAVLGGSSHISRNKAPDTYYKTPTK